MQLNIELWFTKKAQRVS